MPEPVPTNPPEIPGYRAILWVILALATIVDSILLTGIIVSYGHTFGYFMARKIASDPIVAFLAADLAMMRLGLFLLGSRFAGSVIGPMARWLLFVPVMGAPVIAASMIAQESSIRASLASDSASG